MVKGLLAYVYRNSPPTQHNLIKVHQVIVAGPHIPELFEATDDTPAVLLSQGNYPGIAVCKVLETPTDGVVMFGGSYVASQDGRFDQAVAKIIGSTHFYGAIPLHDWFETWEGYNLKTR